LEKVKKSIDAAKKDIEDRMYIFKSISVFVLDGIMTPIKKKIPTANKTVPNRLKSTILS
jgi:hypothetical protein